MEDFALQQDVALKGFFEYLGERHECQVLTIVLGGVLVNFARQAGIIGADVKTGELAMRSESKNLKGIGYECDVNVALSDGTVLSGLIMVEVDRYNKIYRCHTKSSLIKHYVVD